MHPSSPYVNTVIGECCTVTHSARICAGCFEDDPPMTSPPHTRAPETPPPAASYGARAATAKRSSPPRGVGLALFTTTIFVCIQSQVDDGQASSVRVRPIMKRFNRLMGSVPADCGQLASLQELGRSGNVLADGVGASALGKLMEPSSDTRGEWQPYRGAPADGRPRGPPPRCRRPAAQPPPTPGPSGARRPRRRRRWWRWLGMTMTTTVPPFLVRRLRWS